jgi:hypothetical protein
MCNIEAAVELEQKVRCNRCHRHSSVSMSVRPLFHSFVDWLCLGGGAKTFGKQTSSVCEPRVTQTLVSIRHGRALPMQELIWLGAVRVTASARVSRGVV